MPLSNFNTKLNFPDSQARFGGIGSDNREGGRHSTLRETDPEYTALPLARWADPVRYPRKYRANDIAVLREK